MDHEQTKDGRDYDIWAYVESFVDERTRTTGLDSPVWRAAWAQEAERMLGEAGVR